LFFKKLLYVCHEFVVIVINDENPLGNFLSSLTKSSKDFDDLVSNFISGRMDQVNSNRTLSTPHLSLGSSSPACLLDMLLTLQKSSYPAQMQRLIYISRPKSAGYGAFLITSKVLDAS
jgi:hypothetical protein